MSDQYELLRALVLAGAQNAAGLAVLLNQGVWAWLRLALPEPAAPVHKGEGIQGPSRADSRPLRNVGGPPPQARQLAQAWAQMVLARTSSTAAAKVA